MRKFFSSSFHQFHPYKRVRSFVWTIVCITQLDPLALVSILNRRKIIKRKEKNEIEFKQKAVQSLGPMSFNPPTEIIIHPDFSQQQQSLANETAIESMT